MSTAGICTAIAGLTISGVSVLDLSAVPDAMFAPGAYTLFPHPQFITAAKGEVLSFRPRSYQVERALRYVYLHQECGSDRLANVMPALATKADAIIVAMLTLADSFRLTACGIGEFGPLNPTGDAAGKTFWGFQISMTIVEFV